MARYFHDWAKRFYPAPAASAKADGFNINLSGDAEFQAKLVRLGPLVVARALRIMQTQGTALAMEANAAAPRGGRQKGRRGGRLAQSFRYYDRPRWQKLGKVGVAVRSRTKYHYYQEFGVDSPNTQVVLHRDAFGRKVRRGQGIDAKHGRYAIGTNRLNPGVFVKSYRRDIILRSNPFFGEIVRRSKDKLFQESRDGLLSYISRLSAGDAGDLGSDRTD